MDFKWVESLIIKNLKKQIDMQKRGSQFLLDKHPPLAPLVLRVAVSGHRLEPDNLQLENRKRSIPNVRKIEIAINEVLDVICESFKDVSLKYGNLFELTDSGSKHLNEGTLRIISSLASGADQWVATAAVNKGYELQTILPFNRKDYINDFSNKDDINNYLKLLDKATSILEIDGKIVQNDFGSWIPDSQSYEVSGRAVLNQSDLLIAIWDGNESYGKGGTGQIVNEAIQKSVPVVLVPWETPENWCLLNAPSNIVDEKIKLASIVEKLLMPPVVESSSSTDNLRQDYFDETQKKGNLHLGLWILFRNLISGELFKKHGFRNVVEAFHVDDFINAEEKSSEEFWNIDSISEHRSEPIDKTIQKWINERFSKHYAWSNGLSIYYGNMHRSSFLINYILGAIAVFFALVCIAFSIAGKAQTGWIVAELIVIITILIHTHHGLKMRWHQKWIDYRLLAERLRMSRCLALFGGGNSELVYNKHLSTYGNPAHTWMSWHYQSIVRAAGIPPLKFNEQYLTSCQELWKEGLLKNQIKYHRLTTLRFEKMNIRLHKIGDSLFIATMILCILHLAHIWIERNSNFTWIPENIANLTSALCAFLPVLGATCAAIRNHSEVQRLAQRSKAMDEALCVLQKEFKDISIKDKSLTSVQLHNIANQINHLMTNEMLDWRVVFQDQPLGLPS